VRAYPATEWIIQQFREASPYDTAPRYLIFDRDDKSGQSVVTAMSEMSFGERQPTAHSDRSAVDGSTRAASLAGTKHAASATVIKTRLPSLRLPPRCCSPASWPPTHPLYGPHESIRSGLCSTSEIWLVQPPTFPEHALGLASMSPKGYLLLANYPQEIGQG